MALIDGDTAMPPVCGVIDFVRMLISSWHGLLLLLLNSFGFQQPTGGGMKFIQLIDGVWVHIHMGFSRTLPNGTWFYLPG